MRADKHLDLSRIAYAVFQDHHDREGGRGTVVAVTSPSAGEGVSYVSRLISRKLAGDQLGKTLCCTVEALANAPLESEGGEPYILADERLWTLSCCNPVAKSGWEFNRDIRQARVEALRRRFDHVILDCPAVSKGAGMAAVAPIVDAVLLVVGAGRSTKRQIAYAQEVIAESGGLLRACILNGRTYPIPSLIYHLLMGNPQ